MPNNFSFSNNHHGTRELKIPATAIQQWRAPDWFKKQTAKPFLSLFANSLNANIRTRKAENCFLSIVMKRGGGGERRKMQFSETCNRNNFYIKGRPFKHTGDQSKLACNAASVLLYNYKMWTARFTHTPIPPECRKRTMEVCGLKCVSWLNLSI